MSKAYDKRKVYERALRNNAVNGYVNNAEGNRVPVPSTPGRMYACLIAGYKVGTNERSAYNRQSTAKS